MRKPLSTKLGLLGKLTLAALLLPTVSSGCRQAPVDPSTSAKKAPGEHLTLAWDYPSSQEPRIRGFALKQAASREGPYRTIANVGANQRKVDFQISFEEGKSSSYYVVVALEGETESLATNPVEIQRK